MLEYSKKIRIPFFSNMQQIPRCQNQILPDEPTTLLLFLACRSTKWSYLIVQIMIDNADRAGVLACMTVKEFKRATVKGNYHIVRVLHHKTMDTHGPVQIVVTSHLYNYITVFMYEMCSQHPDLNCLDKQCSCHRVESTWNHPR